MIQANPMSYRLPRRGRERGSSLGFGSGSRVAILLTAFVVPPSLAEPVQPDSLFQESLEQLITRQVTSATKRPQAPAEVPAFVSIIEAEEIHRFGWTTLAEALDSLPGINVSFDRSYHSLGVRGLGRPGDYNSRVLLLIDGVPLNDGIYDQAPIGADFPLDLALVQRIEFVPGPGSVLYGGNAMFAVVNVITRSGAMVGGEIELAAGSGRAWSARASVGRRGPLGNTWLLSATRARSAGKDLFFDSYAAPGANAWSRNLDYQGQDQVFGRFARGGFTATGMVGERRRGIPGGAYGIDLDDPRNQQTDRRQFGSLRYELPLSALTTLNLHGYAGGYVYRSTWVYSGAAQPDSLNNFWLGSEASISTKALSGQTLLLGISRRNDRLRRQFNPTLDVDTPRRSMGIFIQDDWAVSEKMTVSAGIRFDRNWMGMRHTSPRLALLLQPASGTTIKAIAGHAFRPPNAFESDYAFAGTNIANPGLRHEHVYGRELGIEHRYGQDRQVAAQVYSNRLDDLIALETDAATGLAQHHNVGRVYMRGSSIDARWRFGEFIVAGSMSWQDVRHESGARLSNTPGQLFKLRLAAPLGSTQFVWETRYTGPRLSDSGSITAEGDRQGGFAVSDLGFNGRFGTDTEWQVRAANVFNRRYGHVVGNEFNASFPGTMIQPMPVMIQDGASIEARLRLRF